MIKIQVFVYVLVIMLIVNGACARARNYNDLDKYAKRLFGCVEFGKSCAGFFSSSCCNGYKCHSATGKCVSSGSSGSWLGDRNGK